MTATGRETALSSPIDRVTELLQGLERRLHRLLAAGWRNAGDDLSELAEVAAALAVLGLAETAGLVRAVATANDPATGLRAAGSALAACRLLRVRLAPDLPPSGNWSPVTPGNRASATSRLLALGRFALGDGEVWSCLRFQGSYPVEWVLFEPPKLMGRPNPGGAPWFVRPLTGRLRWRARLPLGAAGEVEVCALDGATWSAPSEPGGHEHVLTAFLQAIRRGGLGEDVRLPVNALTLVPFEPGDLDAYSWPDPAAPAAARAAGATVQNGWLLVWTAGAATPIALISAPPTRSGVGRLRDAIAGRAAPRIVHLVPGLPSEPLADPPSASD